MARPSGRAKGACVSVIFYVSFKVLILPSSRENAFFVNESREIYL